MTDFEDQLRRALERKQPSADFAARVVARATGRKRPAPWANWRSWAAAGIAASLLLGAVGVNLEHRQKEREQGEMARVQLMQAMQITSSRLHRIEKKVQSALK